MNINTDPIDEVALAPLYLRLHVRYAVACAARTMLTIVFCALAFAGCGNRWASFEKQSLNPGVTSNATPAQVGLAFERIAIPSGPRLLDGFVVRASLTCGQAPAVLMFHGRGETVADWIGVQRLLYDNCISSMVFDYSGHGHSTGPGTIANLNDDALAAYRAFSVEFPAPTRRCLLSHSMGGAPMLYAATRVVPAPDCVVAGSPFSSLLDMAVLGGLPPPMRLFMTDMWDNVKTARQLKPPMLWVHSRADSTIPFDMGQRVYAVKPDPKTEVSVTGFDHNAIYQKMPPQIWDPVIAFVRGQGPQATHAQDQTQ